MTQALKDAGVGAEVELADCNEYPCILSGRLPDDAENGNADVFGTVLQNPGMAAYAGGRRSTVIRRATVVDEKGEPKDQLIFSVAFYPAGDPETEEKIRLRMQEREREAAKALTGAE